MDGSNKHRTLTQETSVYACYVMLLHSFDAYSILIGQSRRSTVCYFFIAGRCYGRSPDLGLRVYFATMTGSLYIIPYLLRNVT